MKRLVVALAGASILAACEPTQPEPAPLPEDACGAAGYQTLIGASLAAASFPAGLNMRVIRPGDMVTMDYRADRMNVELDADGRIVKIFCG